MQIFSKKSLHMHPEIMHNQLPGILQPSQADMGNEAVQGTLHHLLSPCSGECGGGEGGEKPSLVMGVWGSVAWETQAKQRDWGDSGKPDIGV